MVFGHSNFDRYELRSEDDLEILVEFSGNFLLLHLMSAPLFISVNMGKLE